MVAKFTALMDHLEVLNIHNSIHIGAVTFRSK